MTAGRISSETVEAWVSVLVLVDSATLVLASRACRVLRLAFTQALKHLQSDISGGQEPVRIPCANDLDAEVVPRGYTYRSSCQLPFHPPQIQGSHGCSCTGKSRACEDAGCACCTDMYDSDGRLRALKGVSERDLQHGVAAHIRPPQTEAFLQECGPVCSCSRLTSPVLCGNRISQAGVSIMLHLEKDHKGWKVVADSDINPGTFVCEYAGEVLTTREAMGRLTEYDNIEATRPGHALLIVREIMPSRTASLRLNIDATRVGNVARFINHACDGGNLTPIVVRMAGSVLPRVCLYASKTIPVGAEITFAYGEPSSGLDQGPGGNSQRRRRPCCCDSAACKGFLPSCQ